MELGLRDKVVFVTGASGGIGRAVARVLADEGARLVLHGHRNAARLAAWAREQPWAERALPVSADVADADALERAFDAARERFGRVDACIANAGIWPPEDVPLADLDVERIRAVFETNLLGAVFTARAFLRALRATGPRSDGDGASLVFTGSTAARFGEMGHADYASAKAGLYGLMRSAKNEIAVIDPFGRANIVEPGWTVTEMTRDRVADEGVVARVARTMPLRQLARAVDVARTIAFVVSPRAARHLSGQTITVAGGMEGRVLWEDRLVDGAAMIERSRETD